jgi:hypothetical protein
MKAKRTKQWNACRQHCQSRKSLLTNAKARVASRGSMRPETPIVMMMLLKEDCLSQCRKHTGVCDSSRKQDPVVRG